LPFWIQQLSLGDVDTHYLLLLAVLIAAAFAARALVLFVLMPLLELVKLTQPISSAYKYAIRAQFRRPSNRDQQGNYRASSRGSGRRLGCASSAIPRLRGGARREVPAPMGAAARDGRYQAFSMKDWSREHYDDLKRGISGNRAEPRPRFQIGLDTHRLIERLDILSGLDERQLERVAQLLRPRFTVPSERIVRRADRGTPCSLPRPGQSR
jgi:hypothetical protein